MSGRDSKTAEYVARSERAAANIAAWPAWMQHNLRPPTEHIPQRIQRERTKGWRMPDGAVYVGRPSRWGNPFALGDAQASVDAFVVHLSSYFGWRGRAIQRAFYPLPVESTEFRDWLAPLAGHDLACWCPLDQPCHADVLLELAAAA